MFTCLLCYARDEDEGFQNFESMCHCACESQRGLILSASAVVLWCPLEDSQWLCTLNHIFYTSHEPSVSVSVGINFEDLAPVHHTDEKSWVLTEICYILYFTYCQQIHHSVSSKPILSTEDVNESVFPKLIIMKQHVFCCWAIVEVVEGFGYTENTCLWISSLKFFVFSVNLLTIKKALSWLADFH